MDAARKAELLHSVVRKMMTGGADIKTGEWLEFVKAQNDDLHTGPEIGAKVPEFVLPDQSGRDRSLHDLMGPNGLLLVFSRSADWCPYCRNHLAELQSSLPQLKAHGVNAASITYDAREILSNFGEAHKIEYPLLSDVGSRVIRAFGVLNTNVPEDHQMMYGMAFPGDFLIAPDGTVRDKLFLPNYEYRPSASEVVLRHFDNKGANSIELNAGVLDATVSLSTDRCFPGYELGLALHVHVKLGWHVYGNPLPANYKSLEMTLDSPLIEEQSLMLPDPQQLSLKTLGETLPVYEGELEAHGKVRFRWSPPIPAPFLTGLGEKIEPGRYQVAGRLQFQACSDTVCEPPQSIKFVLPLTIAAGTPAAVKKAA